MGCVKVLWDTSYMVPTPAAWPRFPCADCGELLDCCFFCILVQLLGFSSHMRSIVKTVFSLVLLVRMEIGAALFALAPLVVMSGRCPARAAAAALCLPCRCCCHSVSRASACRPFFMASSCCVASEARNAPSGLRSDI